MSEAQPGGGSARRCAGHAARPARRPDSLSIAACGVLIPIVLVAVRCRLPGAPQPRRGDDPRHGPDRDGDVWPGTGRPGSRSRRRSRSRSSRSRSMSTSARACSGATGAVWPARCAGAPHARAITTVELGSAPLEYYLPGLHGLHEGSSVRVSEIDETGYAPAARVSRRAARARFSPTRSPGCQRADRLSASFRQFRASSARRRCAAT